jgi:hypothetical protein
LKLTNSRIIRPSKTLFHRILLKNNNSFVITTVASDNKDYFNLVPQEKINDCMVDKDLFEKGMVPAALKTLSLMRSC